MEIIQGIVSIKGILTLESNLIIGGTKDDIGISSTDNPIVKHLISGEPYIPGSSIKGKMRSLYELSGQGKGTIIDKPCNCGKKSCMICKVFGTHMNTKAEVGKTRAIFRDAILIDEFKDSFDIDIVEIETKTMINRQTGTAQNSSLRKMESITSGSKFHYQIDILYMENDNKRELISFIENGLRLIEFTGLGGKVSSGHGKINFGIGDKNYKIEDKNFGDMF